MTTLIVVKELSDDLDKLFETQPDEVAAVDLLLELLTDDEHLLFGLRAPEFHHETIPVFEFKQFESAVKRGLNVYILKYYDPNHGHLCNYRLFVGHHAQRDTYYALTVAHRPSAYDVDSDWFKALVARYEQYGVPKIPGIR